MLDIIYNNMGHRIEIEFHTNCIIGLDSLHLLLATSSLKISSGINCSHSSSAPWCNPVSRVAEKISVCNVSCSFAAFYL